MSALESRYRRALAWYPRSWRERSAEAMLGTLLDQADADARTQPARGELTRIRLDGVAARLNVAAPSWLRDGVASIVLGSITAYALLTAGFVLGRAATTPSWVSPPFSTEAELLLHYFGARAAVPWAILAVVALLLTVACVAVIAGATRVARWCAFAAAVLALALKPLANLLMFPWQGIGPALAFIAVGALLAGVGRPTRRATVVAFGVSLAAWLVIGLMAQGMNLGEYGLVFGSAAPFSGANVLVVTAGVLLTMGISGALRGHRAALIVAACSIPWFPAAMIAARSAAGSDMLRNVGCALALLAISVIVAQQAALRRSRAAGPA